MEKELPSLKIGQLESELPIVSGGMSVGFTTGEFAAAVANAGGYGTIGGIGLCDLDNVKGPEGYFNANDEALANEIKISLELSENGNVGVNLMVAVANYERLVKVAVENGAKYIASGAGIPSRLPEYVDKYLAPGQQKPELIPIVSSVRAAKIILEKWKKYGILPSAIVVETPNTAGGHLGAKLEDVNNEEYSLEKVIPALVEYFGSDEYAEWLKGFNGEKHDIPIIAAGGMWDRRDINRMTDSKIGAAAVQMATRFIVAEECGAPIEIKEKYLSNDYEIELVHSPAGLPGRAFGNALTRGELLDVANDDRGCFGCLKRCEYREKKIGYCILRALHATLHGDTDKGLMFIGSNGHRLAEEEIAPVSEIVQKIIKPVA
jgi:nitronate monooxygenase